MDGIDNLALFLIIVFFSGILYICWSIIGIILKRQPRRNNIDFNPQNPLNEDENEECSICLSRIRFKVDFICSHSFCMDCIISWISRSRPSNITCPLCRREVLCILMNFERNEQTSSGYDSINDYNLKNLNGFNFYYFYTKDLLLILNQGIKQIFDSFQSTLVFFLLFLFVIIYFYLPYDIIPDDVEIIGLLDDLFVFLSFIIWICECFMRVHRGESVRRQEEIRRE